MGAMPKLSSRLRFLQSLLLEGEDVWDLCCDHGLLGEAAWASGRHPHVHLVDRVPAIMERLRARLGEREGMSFWTEDAGRLPVILGGTVVIAGVGGSRISEILEALRQESRLQARRLVLSPHKDEEDLAKNLPQILGPEWKLVATHQIEEGPRVRPVLLWERVP